LGNQEFKNIRKFFNIWSHRSPFKRTVRDFHLGTRSFTNLSLYSFGLSGLWTAVSSVILPFKILEVLEIGTINVFGQVLDKNGALGVMSLIGLPIGAMIQLISGSISDYSNRLGKRLPYLLFGGIGLAISTVLIGFATTFVSLFLMYMAIQIFGNAGQGPANALIVDHVPPRRRGEASGVLNLWRLMGAGIVTVIVLQFMANYQLGAAPQWLWYSITFIVVILIASTLWTTLSLRPSLKFKDTRLSRNLALQNTPLDNDKPNLRINLSKSYLIFLIALAFSIAALSSLQIYALFFLQDVVGLANPADGADLLTIVVIATAVFTVLPAGKLADKFGRGALFFIAGLSGVAGSTLLLFVNSIAPVLGIGALLGFSAGLFLTLTWAVANDLVSRMSAGKELGYTSIATLAGSAAARFAGIGIDELNNLSENLGYKAMLIAVAMAFIIATVLLAGLVKNLQHNDT
tara:strand:- start:549 stop:1931 length:1383 start_codon:yes stop_codon:yes gene_type:complete